MTPDVNVLVAAARVDHPHRAVARAWFDRDFKKLQGRSQFIWLQAAPG